MKYLKVAFTLAILAIICGGLIALVNSITEPMIKEKNEKKEKETLNEIYPECEYLVSDIILTKDNEKYTGKYTIESKYLVKSEEETIGTILKITGKNQFGVITIIIGINSDKDIKDIKIVQNTESYAQVINDHFESNYENLQTYDDLQNVDIYCGATRGAEMLKGLVELAFMEIEESSIN